MDSCSFCLMFLSSSLASFIVGASEKQLLNLVSSALSERYLQDITTHLTAPVNFLMISVLKSCSLTQQAWSISSIQSLKNLSILTIIAFDVGKHCIICLIAASSCQFVENFLLDPLAGCHHLQQSGLYIGQLY